MIAVTAEDSFLRRFLSFIKCVYTIPMPTANKKIAIIDDDPLILDLYVRKFTERGYKILATNDRDFSMEKLLAFTPKILLLDINMPTKSGLDILKEIRETSKTPLYTILLTNNDEKTLMEKGRSLGANEYIVKVSKTPAEIADIVDTVLQSLS